MNVLATGSLRPTRGFLERWRFALWKYIVVLRISIANNLAYAMEVLFRSLLLIVLVFCLSQLWKTTFSLSGTKSLNGFTITDMIWYLATAEAITMSLPMLTRRIDQEVRSGQLAYLLGRPCSYIFYNFAQYLGERLVRFMINCLLGAGLALVMVGLPNFTWQGILAWPLVTFLAMCIEFVAYFCIGLLAFWMEETQPIVLIFNRLTLILGGVLVPLDVFPQPLRGIAQALPFGAILYGPARTLVHFEMAPFLSLLWQQVIVIVVGSVILWMIYRIAVRRVNMNGG